MCIRDSHIIDGELEQNRTMGTAVPLVFLGIASFLLNIVLGRLIATQRNEIAVLKAFGYTNLEIGRHYLLFAMAAVLGGACLLYTSDAADARTNVELRGPRII